MTELARRIFTTDDQRAFAALTGDWNPMHMDPVAARRTLFGGCVVHGIHGLAWALDTLARREGPLAIRTLDARFLQPIAPGEEVSCKLATADGTRRVLLLEKNGVEITRVTLELGGNAVWDRALDFSTVETPAAPPAALALDWQAAAAAAGEFTVGKNPAAAVLALTRIVGMLCPGLHSLFSSLRLAFTSPGDGLLRYHVARAEPRFSMIRIGISGAGIEGTLETFFRPPPQPQPTLADLRPLVTPGEFSGARAWVLGGSRGLGEVAAKLLAAGGAQVAISYASGAADAQTIAAEIGGHAFRYLVGGDGEPLPFAPTHLLYWATPRIAVNKSGTWSEPAAAAFRAIYLDGFRAAIARARAAGSGHLRVLWPSTIFLDQPEPGLDEYRAVKDEGEHLCRALAAADPLLHIHTPRLPKMATDQTTGLLPIKTEPPAPVLLRELRALFAR